MAAALRRVTPGRLLESNGTSGGSSLTEEGAIGIEGLDSLVDLGKDRGYVTAAEISRVLAAHDLSTKQVESLYASLMKLGIRLAEDADSNGVERAARRGRRPSPRWSILPLMGAQACQPATQCACILRRSAVSAFSRPSKKCLLPSGWSGEIFRPSMR